MEAQKHPSVYSVKKNRFRMRIVDPALWLSITPVQFASVCVNRVFECRRPAPSLPANISPLSVNPACAMRHYCGYFTEGGQHRSALELWLYRIGTYWRCVRLSMTAQNMLLSSLHTRPSSKELPTSADAGLKTFATRGQASKSITLAPPTLATMIPPLAPSADGIRKPPNRQPIKVLRPRRRRQALPMLPPAYTDGLLGGKDQSQALTIPSVGVVEAGGVLTPQTSFLSRKQRHRKEEEVGKTTVDLMMVAIAPIDP